jgi:hypothetical protein
MAVITPKAARPAPAQAPEEAGVPGGAGSDLPTVGGGPLQNEAPAGPCLDPSGAGGIYLRPAHVGGQEQEGAVGGPGDQQMFGVAGIGSRVVAVGRDGVNAAVWLLAAAG